MNRTFITTLFVFTGTVMGAVGALSLKRLKGPLDAEGTPRWEMVIHSRGDQRIMTERTSSPKKGSGVVRRYIMPKSFVMTEIDEDGDQKWDSLLFEGDGEVLEAFERVDGKVLPVSDEKLGRMRLDRNKLESFWETNLPPADANK